MRRRLWIPLAALVLGLIAIGGFAAATTIGGSDSDTDDQVAQPVDGEQPQPDLDLPFNDRPFLGVLLGEALEDGGVRVRAVLPGSPAADAGLRRGDVLVAVGDEEVKDVHDVVEVLEGEEAGDSLTIAFLRDGERHEVEITLSGAHPPGRQGRRPFPEPKAGARLGVTIRDITPALQDELRLVAEQGVVVVDIDPGGAAARAGVRVRDVILSVDGRPVETAASLADAIRSRHPGDRVELGIKRDAKSLTIDILLGPGQGLGPPEEAPRGPGILDRLKGLERLRDRFPGFDLDLDLRGAGPEELLRRLVGAEVTFLGDDGEPVTLRLTAGTVKSATSAELVLAPHGGGTEIEFAIDDETRVLRGLRRTEPTDLEDGETAVILTRDNEARAKLVFVLPGR